MTSTPSLVVKAIGNLKSEADIAKESLRHSGSDYEVLVKASKNHIPDPTVSNFAFILSNDQELLQQEEAASLPSVYAPIPIRSAPYSSQINDSRATYRMPSSMSITSYPMSRSTSSVVSEVSNQVPPYLLSPAFTPPTSAPGTPSLAGIPVSAGDISRPTHNPSLMQELPKVTCVVRARIPTTTGTEVFLHLYQNNIDNKEHLAIVFGGKIRSASLDAPRPGETEMDRMIRGAYTGRLYPGRIRSTLPEQHDTPSPSPPSFLPPHTVESQKRLTAPLVRIHSECYTGETAWSARCDCGEQLDEAARLMSIDPNPTGGVIVYLRQEGRGIGLGEKLKAYNLQDLGNDTVQANLILRHPADARSYGLATAILCDLGCREVRLLTNNPDKVAAVEGPNKEIRVVSRVGMVPKMWRGIQGGVEGKEVNEYLKTKIEKMGHMLPPPPPEVENIFGKGGLRGNLGL